MCHRGQSERDFAVWLLTGLAACTASAGLAAYVAWQLGLGVSLALLALAYGAWRAWGWVSR